jgi:hypothetical protein
VTRHGAEVAVVLAAAAYRDLVSQARPFPQGRPTQGSGVEDDDDGGALLDVLPPRGRWRAKPPGAPADE